MAFSKKDREVFGNIFNNIPQVKAWKIVRNSTSAPAMAQAIMQTAGLQDLSEDERRVLHSFMLLDKTRREELAGEIIGQVIEDAASGVLLQFWHFITGRGWK